MARFTTSSGFAGRAFAAVLAAFIIGGEARAASPSQRCAVDRTVFGSLWLGMSEDAARAAIGGGLKRDPDWSDAAGKRYVAEEAEFAGLRGSLQLHFSEQGRLNSIQVLQVVAGTGPAAAGVGRAAAALGLTSASTSSTVKGELTCATSSAAAVGSLYYNRRVSWGPFYGGMNVSASAHEHEYKASPIPRPVEAAPVAAKPSAVASPTAKAPYGPVIGGLRLGMTEAAAQSLLGASMQLHARYRRFAVFNVEAFPMLGHNGRLTLQFDEGVGLSKINQLWTFADVDAASGLIPAALAWAEIDPAEAPPMIRQLRIDDAEARRAAALTPDQRRAELDATFAEVKRSMSLDTASEAPADDALASRLPRPERADMDVKYEVGALAAIPGKPLISVDVQSMRHFPLSAAAGEEPLRHRYSDADEAFDRSLRRAERAQGVLSGHHGVYGTVCRGTNFGSANAEFSRLQLRWRMLIWSEGDRVFSHWGIHTGSKQHRLLTVRGREQLVLQDSAGTKQKVDVFMVDVDEQLPSGLKTRWLLADDRMLLGEGEELKGLTTLKRCERL